MNLLKWTDRYIDYANSFRKNLKKKEINDDRIYCTYDNNDTVYIIRDILDQDIFSEIKEGCIVLVCLNKMENVKFLSENWKIFVRNKKLKVIFANPGTNEKWIICPYTHNMVSEPKALLKGLKSMYENITIIK